LRWLRPDFVFEVQQGLLKFGLVRQIGELNAVFARVPEQFREHILLGLAQQPLADYDVLEEFDVSGLALAFGEIRPFGRVVRELVLDYPVDVAESPFADDFDVTLAHCITRP